jgi:nucleotide-binding universal stress UspA family protein
MIATAIPRKTKRIDSEAAQASGGIVFGTDFSENAHNAAAAAAAIAKRMGEPLTLVHAVDLPKLGKSTADAVKWFTNSRQRDLHQEATMLRKTGSVVEERIVAGRADEVLANCARQERARLVVVSSLGYRGVDRWLVGSVAERTAECATVPTLIVRDPSHLLKWAKDGRPLRVFVCFNRTATSECALSWVKEFSRGGSLEVVVGWVNWPTEEWARVDGNGPLSLTSNTPDVQRILERDVTEKVREILGDASFRVRIEAGLGRPDYHLAEMASEERADLLVVGSHQYRGFERLWHASVSRGLLHRASMSVAVVPHVSGKSRPVTMPRPVQQVLVATDFSELANAAIPRAYSLLHGRGAVHLLHVMLQPGELPPGLQEQIVDCHDRKEEDRAVAECAENLRALVPVEAEAQGILTQVQVIKGRDVAATICQYAERLGVDVICLGSHGRSGLSGTLLGSVTQEVMARSRRPLLVIRQPVI